MCFYSLRKPGPGVQLNLKCDFNLDCVLGFFIYYAFLLPDLLISLFAGLGESALAWVVLAVSPVSRGAIRSILTAVNYICMGSPLS